ncbi:polymorphic toxin type 50 domain-containing protein, partial [Photorhabdus laumondii]
LQEALTGNEVKAQTAKFIGALSGALISHTPEGAYSAANSAELVYRNNMTEHMLYQLSVENQKDILAAGKGDKAAEARVIARQDAAIAVTAVAAGGYALVYGGQILIAASAEMATAGRVALEGCKTNPALCLNNVGIFVADAVAPEAAVGTGVLAAGTVKVLGSTKEGAKNLAGELHNAGMNTLKNVSTGLPSPQGLSKEIHLGQQGKHITGHNNYIPGRSPLAEGVDPQKLLNGVHSGEYPIIRMTPRNQPIVNFGKPIGKYEGQPTNYGIIHYGKNGAHIVPANPIQH